jgi:molybdenum cofactor cytidylyltransferase
MPSEPAPAADVAGIVLAAGTSTRMGRNKLLLQVGGESLLRRAVRRAAAARLHPLLVVLGYDADAAAESIADLPCRPIVNPDYAMGITTSLQAGVRAVPSDAAAVVVVLADMPFVTTGMIAAVVARYRETRAPLVVSEYGDVNAPPSLYDRRLFDELLEMKGEGCGKRVVRRHRAEAVAVRWPAAALTDLDVPDDYDRIRRATVGTGAR